MPAAVTASLMEELASLSPAERGFLHGAAAAGEPFEPDLAAAVAELPAADGLDALDALLALDLVRATAGAAPVRLPPPARAPGGLRVGARRLAACRPRARGRRARPAWRARRRARAPRRAVSEPRATRRAIALLLDAGAAATARAPAAAVRWFEATLRLLPDTDAERQVEVRVALASALRSLGELERCRAMLLEAIELLPAEARRRRGSS